MPTIPTRFRGPARRDAAAYYLAQLPQGLIAGEFAALTGHESVTLQVTEFVELHIAVCRKPRVDHVLIRVRWPRRRVPSRGIPARRRSRILPARARGRGHLDFTSPSLGRNVEARDSHADADHR